MSYKSDKSAIKRLNAYNMSPDITLCVGTNCPQKETCYRFTAKPNEYWQSYFSVPPIKDGKCEYYWGDNSERIFNQLKDIVNGKE
jgi:hypothetical protein